MHCYASAAAAAAAGYPVAPLPTGSVAVGGVYLAPADRGLAARYQQADEGFIVPSSYVGVDRRPEGHLVIVGASSPTNGLVNCFGARRIGQPQIHGHPAVVVTCEQASELHGGHVLLRFTQGRTVVVVSLHGWSKLNQEFVVQLALHLRLVAPSG